MPIYSLPYSSSHVPFLSCGFNSLIQPGNSNQMTLYVDDVILDESYRVDDVIRTVSMTHTVVFNLLAASFPPSNKKTNEYNILDYS